MIETPGVVPIQIEVIGGGLLVVVAVALAVSYFRAVTGDVASGSPSVGDADKISIRVVDEVAGRTYHDAETVLARKNTVDSDDEEEDNDTTSETITLTEGTGSAELEPGEWRFDFEENGETIGRQIYTIDSRLDTGRIALAVEPYIVDLQVTGGPDREPLGGATVEATADVDQWSVRMTTDPDGRAQVEVPRSASAVSFTAEYEGLPSVESECPVERAAREGVELAIVPDTGGIAIETTVGDQPWPEIDVRITPASESTEAYTDEGTVTTNAGGRRTVEGLPTGEYEVAAYPQLDEIETTRVTESVTVVADGTTEVTLSIGIPYSMGPSQRERLDGLRERIAALSTASNRDVAIPRYYGTVLASVLELTEAVASEPERVVGAGVSPDATVEAVLDATEAGLDTVTDSMSDRRVVSLFKACESMPSAEVKWRGEVTLDAFLDRVTEGGNHGCRALRDRLDETDDMLDERWGDVSEMAPARKLHDRVAELATAIDDIEDELVVVARVYVGLLLLDAIEGLFTHDALVERLDGRTL